MYELEEEALDLQLAMQKNEWEKEIVSCYCKDRDRTVFNLMSRPLSRKARLRALEILKATRLETE